MGIPFAYSFCYFNSKFVHKAEANSNIIFKYLIVLKIFEESITLKKHYAIIVLN